MVALVHSKRLKECPQLRYPREPTPHFRDVVHKCRPAKQGRIHYSGTRWRF